MNPALEALDCLPGLGALYGVCLLAKRFHREPAAVSEEAAPVRANPRADMPGEES